MGNLYLIKRGARPDHHKAPFHPVIICDRKPIAEWEAGWTGEGATVWRKDTSTHDGHGWLLINWQGLVINYGFLVRSCDLSDGNRAGFWRDYKTEDGKNCVMDLIPGAVWWSNKVMPQWLADKGVVYPSDRFSQQTILDSIANDGASGFSRAVPKHWKAA